MSDNYPEYLNPFSEDLKSKRKLTIRNSFRELKESLRQSFRIKKKDHEEVTVRQKSDTFRRLPKTYCEPQTVALPRSRFRERLSLSQQNAQTSSLNPFEETEGKEKETKLASVRRKMKKRAPLPPPNKSLSSQNVYEENYDVPGSQWSLTSVETNSSNAAERDVSEIQEINIKRNSMAETFVDFNKNMDQLKDDANNNVVTKDEETVNVPDLVISCPNNSSVENEDKEDFVPPHQSDTCDEDEDKPQNDEKSEPTTVLENEKITTSDTTDKLEVSDSEEPFLYNQRRSLYIAGSKDELNNSITEPDTYTEKVSLYITGSCDNLDLANNNEVCNKSPPEEREDVAPVPKQRKNKLTKNVLLGV